MSDKFKYVHPETLQEVDLNKLPKVYKESILVNKRAQEYLESNKDVAPKRKYKDKEQKKRMETDDGQELATPLRTKELGGIKFVKDPRYDPDKNWRYPYGKQLVQIRKQKSHKLGKTEWKAIYTKDYAIVHGAVKFETIRQLADTLHESKIKWQNGMLSKDEHRALCATMCAISNESPFRSGNVSAATRSKNKTYGITTLLRKHVEVQKDEQGNDIIFIRFYGKDSVLIKKYIKNPLAVLKIKNLMKGKDDEDYLFTDSKGVSITADELNKYCKSIGIAHFHFFRHLRASQQFKESIEELIASGKLPDMPTAKEISKLITSAAEKSAELLGNQAATCIKNYIAPQLMFDVFKKFEVPIPDVFKNLARMPANVTEKDLQEIMKSKYTKGDEIEDDEDIDESLASSDYSSEEKITTFKEDEKKRTEFEEYLIGYIYDDNDIINDPDTLKAVAHVLVPEDFVVDISKLDNFSNKRGDEYHTDRSTEFSCRDSSSVEKWGYNDLTGVKPEDIRKKMISDAKDDLKRILGDK